MDNRFLFRAAPKNDPDAKGLIFDVIEIDYINETVSVDAGDILPWEYDCEDVELLCCTGLSAAKSYRGDQPEDLLIYEGDICKDSLGWIFTVTWDSENTRFIGRHDMPRGDTYVCYVCKEPAVEIIGCIHDQKGGDE